MIFIKSKINMLLENIEHKFEIASKEKDIDTIRELKSDYSDFFEEVEKINRKISNHIHTHDSFIKEIAMIKEHYSDLTYLIPFFERLDLHYIQLQTIRTILLENNKFNVTQLEIALDEKKEYIRELFELISNHFALEKEITMQCNNCGKTLRFHNFYILIDSKITPQLKKEKYEAIGHKCFECSLDKLSYKERSSICRHNICDFDVNCKYNNFRDNQSVLEDLSFRETGYIRIVSDTGNDYVNVLDMEENNE